MSAPGPVTITTSCSGMTRVLTVAEFRSERGLQQCAACFCWDTPRRLSNRRHTCWWTHYSAINSARPDVLAP